MYFNESFQGDNFGKFLNLVGYLVPGILALCDWIEVLTYDFHGYWDNRTGLVAPFSAQPGDENYDEEETGSVVSIFLIKNNI